MAAPTAQTRSSHAGRTVLIVEQGFLKSRRGKPVHGVELFRLLLIEQMLGLGLEVTVTAERSWRARLEERFGREREGLRIVYTPNLGGALPNGVVAALRVAGRSYDGVIFGDARRGLIPAVHLVARLVRSGRRILFAHRRPPERVLRGLGRVRLDVVAVSEFVAHRFRGRMAGRVDVMYGLADAERFAPASEAERAANEARGVVRFVLVGRLPNVSKGEDRAIAAFEMLPPEVRERSELHLASFIHPVDVGVEGVVAHEWIASSEMPSLLRSMDVMLALSSNETFSQAIVQGMLTALPVVSTALPVYVEKMDTGAGIVAETDEAIAAAMERLANDASLRRTMGEAGRRTALERYVWSTDRFVREHLFPGDARAGD